MKTKEQLITLWSDTAINRIPAETSDIKYGENTFSTTEIRVLKYICMNPGIASVSLAKSSGRTRGTISIIMKKFSALGLTEFRDDPEHRKRKLIFPTSLGIELCEKRKSTEENKIGDILNKLEKKYSRSEMQLITDALYTVLVSDYSSLYK